MAVMVIMPVLPCFGLTWSQFGHSHQSREDFNHVRGFRPNDSVCTLGSAAASPEVLQIPKNVLLFEWAVTGDCPQDTKSSSVGSEL